MTDMVLYSNNSWKTTVEPEFFDVLKKATLKKLTEPGLFDPKIYQLLVDINNLDGYTTLWSCSGHPEIKDNIEFYIMLVLRDDVREDFLSKVAKFKTPVIENHVLVGTYEDNVNISIDFDTCGFDITESELTLGIPSWRISSYVTTPEEVDSAVTSVRRLLDLDANTTKVVFWLHTSSEEYGHTSYCYYTEIQAKDNFLIKQKYAAFLHNTLYPKGMDPEIWDIEILDSKSSFVYSQINEYMPTTKIESLDTVEQCVKFQNGLNRACILAPKRRVFHDSNRSLLILDDFEYKGNACIGAKVCNSVYNLNFAARTKNRCSITGQVWWGNSATIFCNCKLCNPCCKCGIQCKLVGIVARAVIHIGWAVNGYCRSRNNLEIC